VLNFNIYTSILVLCLDIILFNDICRILDRFDPVFDPYLGVC